MESKKQLGSSSSSPPSSSFTADLFGSTPPSESTGFFASIFPPPSTVLDRKNSYSEPTGYTQKQSSGNRVWSNGQGSVEIIAKKNEGASNNISNKGRKSIFQEREQTCPLSSALYYGGQEDMYVDSSSPQTFGSYPILKKDAAQDDPNGNNSQSASRGNWWQGSLYY